MVHEFFRQSSAAIIGHDGIVDNFRGDAVLAFFNVPIKHEDYIERAITVAERMQAAVPRINDRFGHPNLLQVGMAITAGMVYTSVIGSEDCKDYTVMGDAVNLCARLQDQAGPGEILASYEVYRTLRDRYPDAREVVMRVKGIQANIRAYTLAR